MIIIHIGFEIYYIVRDLCIGIGYMIRIVIITTNEHNEEKKIQIYIRLFYKTYTQLLFYII